eukprot:Tbor_TRINITY_DN8236_c0_g1::TRINITY_DN8236_c0_g1_i1::g.15436::m.15436
MMRRVGVKYCHKSRTQFSSTCALRIPNTANTCSLASCTQSTFLLRRHISDTCLRKSSLLYACRNNCTSTSNSLVVGNTANGIRTSEESMCVISDIIGPGGVTTGGTLSSGIIRRMSGGDILGIMDLCASRCALLHLTGVKVFPTTKPPKELGQLGDGSNDSEASLQSLFPYSVATVATDCTNFIHPLLEGDPIVVRGVVVNVGASSIGVCVEVDRIQFPTREKLTVAYSFFTMVAMDRSLMKANVVPALSISHPRHLYLQKVYHKELTSSKLMRIKHEEFKVEYKKAMECEKYRDGGEMSILQQKRTMLLKLFDGIETPINKNKQFKSTFASSRIEASRIFFPGHLNFNHTIFGGELLRWMEMHAVHCGRLFTGRPYVSSIGMHNVTFKRPIFLNDWVTLEANVVYVHNSTMEVDVKLSIEHIVGAADNGEVQGNGLKKIITTTEQTNTASFVLILLDEIGQRRKIETGLMLCPSDGESTEDSIANDIKWLRRYSEAKLRYKMRQDERLQKGYDAERQKYQWSSEKA